MDESLACVRTVLMMPCKTHTHSHRHTCTYIICWTIFENDFTLFYRLQGLDYGTSRGKNQYSKRTLIILFFVCVRWTFWCYFSFSFVWVCQTVMSVVYITLKPINCGVLKTGMSIFVFLETYYNYCLFEGDKKKTYWDISLNKNVNY